LDDVTKRLCPNVHVFPFLSQVACATKFMANVHEAFPATLQHWKLARHLNDFHFVLAQHSDNGAFAVLHAARNHRNIQF